MVQSDALPARGPSSLLDLVLSACLPGPEGRAEAEARGFTRLPHLLPTFLLWGMSSRSSKMSRVGGFLWFLPQVWHLMR